VEEDGCFAVFGGAEVEIGGLHNSYQQRTF